MTTQARSALSSLTLALALGGCLAEGEEARRGAVAGEPAHDHPCAALACRGAANLAIEVATNQDALLQAQTDRDVCLRAANDEAAILIEALLAEDDSPGADTVGATLEAIRSSASEVCGIVVAATDTGVGSAARMIGSACLANREDDLAALIDAWVNLGTGTFPLAQDGAQADLCAQSEASTDMAQCLEDELVGRITALAEAIVGNDPSQSRDEAVADVQQMMLAAFAAAEQLCATLAATRGAEDAAADCRADALRQLGEELGTVGDGAAG